MQIEILGSGGAVSTPRPGCMCRVCQQARSLGLPYSRGGPSLFVHGPDVLIDTPEEIAMLLNRSQVQQIKACFYSHWHPDHTMGRRIWEMNFDWNEWPPQNRCTDIYLPLQVARDFRERLGLWDHFEFLASRGVVRLHVVEDGQTVTIGNTRITPIRLAENFVYAFLFEAEGIRVLIAMDELHNWRPPRYLRGLDLAIIPMGLIDVDPLTGARRIAWRNPVLNHEATFTQTLEIVRQLEPRHAVLSHIEEPGGLDYEELEGLASQLQEEGLPVSFAYDTMMLSA